MNRSRYFAIAQFIIGVIITIIGVQSHSTAQIIVGVLFSLLAIIEWFFSTPKRPKNPDDPTA